MASRRGHHRRGSIEQPVNMSSDVTHLKEELNRLHKDIFPQCNKHMEQISDLINDFCNVLRPVIYALRGAIITGIIAVVFSALSFFVYDDTVSLILAVAGAALAGVAVLFLAFWQSRKTQLENLKRTVEEECKGFQVKMNPIIDIMEKICQRTEEILRDPFLSDHNTQTLSEHFAYCFKKKPLLEHDSKMDWMSKIGHLSEKLSEMMAKVSSVPDILKEIVEDNKRQRDKSAKPTREQIHKREFKETAEKIINDMQKGICELKNGVKEMERISNRLSSA